MILVQQGVETLIERLHESWDVQSCLFALKLVVQRKEWSRLLALGASRLRNGNRSWSRPLESMLVLGLYQHFSESEPSQKRRRYMCTEPKDLYRNSSVRICVPLITGNKYLWPVNFLNSIIAVKSILRMGCWIDIMIWLLDCWEIHIFGSTMCLEPISKMTCLFLSLCVSLTSLSPRSAPLALSLMSTVSVCRLRLVCVVVQTLADPNTLTKQTSPSSCPLLCLSCFSFAPIYPRETKGQK